jgi:glycosidase
MYKSTDETTYINTQTKPKALCKAKVLAIAASILLAAACGQAPKDSGASDTSETQVSVSLSSKAAQPEAFSTSASQQLAPYLERDISDEIFYFVMPDRFHNAKPENDMGDPNEPISYGGLDKSSKWAFHGGDLMGVEAKLDYLENMGVTSIWMTPILRNKAVQKDGFGHHGYWVVDFTQIDPHFGSNDELKSLIDAAHSRNIRVFFDIITNHTADVIKFEECHDELGKFKDASQTGCEFITEADMASGKTYTPFVPEAEKGAKVPEWLNDPKYYNNQGDSIWEGESVITGDFAGLDDLNTSLPEVQNKLTEVFIDLISDFRPDGFRIDTVKHVDIEFWQMFGPAITEHAQSIGIPNFHIFGEVYDGNPAGLSKYTTKGKLPSVLDFGFFFNIKDAVLQGQDINRIGNLFDNDDYYRDADSGPEHLLTFLGNHDAGRVGHFIQSAFSDADDAQQLRRSKLAHALMYISRGVPVVYYGDEQGFTGDGGDVDAREDMDPSLVDVYNDNVLIGTNKTTANDNFDTEHPIYQSLSELAQVRVQHKALRGGNHQNVMVDNDKRIYAFLRTDVETKEQYLAIFNLSEDTQTVTVAADSESFETIYTLGDVAEPKIGDGQVMTSMEGLSSLVLKAKQSAPVSEIATLNIQDIYSENDRQFIPVNVSFSSQHTNKLIEVRFYAADAQGNTQFLAADNTSPYRAVVLPEQLEGVVKIMVEANNYNGQTVKAELSIQ